MALAQKLIHKFTEAHPQFFVHKTLFILPFPYVLMAFSGGPSVRELRTQSLNLHKHRGSQGGNSPWIWDFEAQIQCGFCSGNWRRFRAQKKHAKSTPPQIAKPTPSVPVVSLGARPLHVSLFLDANVSMPINQAL